MKRDAVLTRRAILQAPVIIMAVGVATASAEGTPRPDQAYLYIISPTDGQHLRGAFWCRFGLRNMGVAPAGTDFRNSGHHHLLIDVEQPPKPGEAIPADNKHMHFGAGQTEVRLELPHGYHTLQLVLGDGNHLVFDPPLMSRKVRILVV